MSEKPSPQRPRRLSHWINVEQSRKVHSLVDKVYSRKNLALAWEAVRRNRGAAGVDRQSLEDFASNLEENLDQLHEELRTKTYEPQALRRVHIPKAGKKGELRPLGIPAVRDRICQQALAQRLAPIFEPDFDDSSYGYRPGRSPHDAMRKIWREIQAGRVWVVDADLSDFFGSVDHALDSRESSFQGVAPSREKGSLGVTIAGSARALAEVSPRFPPRSPWTLVPVRRGPRSGRLAICVTPTQSPGNWPAAEPPSPWPPRVARP